MRITYRSTLGADESSKATVTVVEGSPAERVYRRSAAWEEVSRAEAPTPEPAEEEPAAEPAEEEPAKGDPEEEPADLAEAYAAAANIGEVKALVAKPADAAVILRLEQDGDTPRSTLVEWLKEQAGDAAEPEPAPEAEPTF